MVFRLAKTFCFIFYPEFDFFQSVADRSWDRFYILFDLLKKSHNYSFIVLNYLFWNELTFLVTYNVKGSLHTTIFSKYTELLQLKNISRIF